MTFLLKCTGNVESKFYTKKREGIVSIGHIVTLLKTLNPNNDNYTIFNVHTITRSNMNHFTNAVKDQQKVHLVTLLSDPIHLKIVYFS